MAPVSVEACLFLSSATTIIAMAMATSSIEGVAFTTHVNLLTNGRQLLPRHVWTTTRHEVLLSRPQRRYRHKQVMETMAQLTIPTQLMNNLYDDWSLDLLSSSQSEYTFEDLLSLTADGNMDIEESVVLCLEEFMDSEFGKTMFGRHPVPASVGITGSIEFVSLEGPEVILSLTGKFWHRRETVLGKAAMYINARIPELTSIRVASPDELADFEDIIDEFTGEVLYREDKRSPDFNGDRETMEYQGLNPDARGPFIFASGGSMIRPA